MTHKVAKPLVVAGPSRGLMEKAGILFTARWPSIRRLAVALLVFALLPLSHATEADGFSMPRQDFIVMEAGTDAYGFRFQDLVVLDPREGSMLKVLPMSPRLPDDLNLRPSDRLRFYPTNWTAVRTVVAPSGQTVAHNRVMGRDASSRRMHSYVWRLASGELVLALSDAYGFALLGEDGDHLAVLAEDKSVSVTEFQVWDTGQNQMVFKARFPEARRVVAHQTSSTRFAVFSLDNDYVMLWDHEQQQLHRIAIPEGRRLRLPGNGDTWNMYRGENIVISADDRWLAFIGDATRQVPAYNFHLVELGAAGELQPVKLQDSGRSLGNPFNWVAFGAGLLGANETSLRRLALPFDQMSGTWSPKAWVARRHSPSACTANNSRELSECSQSPESVRDRARRAFVPSDALLEPIQVDIHSRYIASNDGKLLVAWDSYNRRPIILDASTFPPRELSPARPDATDPAALHEFRPGIPRDDGQSAGGLLRFSHFARHLVIFTPEPGFTSSPPVRVQSYSVPALIPGAAPELTLADYLLARSRSAGVRHPALCRLEPEACLAEDAAATSEAGAANRTRDVDAPMRFDIFIVEDEPDPIEAWMRRDPSRERASAPDLCRAFERIQRPIQGEPFIVDERFEGIRIVGQGEIVSSDPAIPFREGDILFDGGWCRNTVCSADEFAREIKRLCASRGHDLVRNLVLEVGSADPARNRSWIMLEKR